MSRLVYASDTSRSYEVDWTSSRPGIVRPGTSSHLVTVKAFPAKPAPVLVLPVFSWSCLPCRSGGMVVHAGGSPPSPLQTVTSWKDVETDRVSQFNRQRNKKDEMWEWTMAVSFGTLRNAVLLLNHLNMCEPFVLRTCGVYMWPDNKTQGGEHVECLPAPQAASEWSQNHNSCQRRWEKGQWKQLWVTRVFLWKDGHLEVIKGPTPIAMAPEADKWLLKPLRLSHGIIPATLQQLIHHNWSIPIPMNSYTLNHFYRRVNENCRTGTHSLSSINIGPHGVFCGFSEFSFLASATEARVNYHSYGPPPCRKLLSAHTSRSAVVPGVAWARRGKVEVGLHNAGRWYNLANMFQRCWNH